MTEHSKINWRKLCQELLGALENEGHAHWPGGPDGDPLIEQARAALAAAQPDGSAVPEGREPASVAGEPTSPPDWRGLCEELVDEWDNVADQDFLDMDKAVERTRAALSQPEPDVVGPSDEEIMGLMPQQMHEDLAAAVRALAEQEGIDSTPAKGVMRIMLNRHIVDLARAVLARWGRPAPAPAGERQAAPVPDCERNWDSLLSPSGGYEMADDAALRDGAQLINGEWWAPVFGCDSLQAALDRIRERLERQAAPVPVAVSDRLPQPEDCDAEGRCWAYDGKHLPAYMTGPWQLRELPNAPLVAPNERSITSNYFWRNTTHWLPAKALPLPGVE